MTLPVFYMHKNMSENILSGLLQKFIGQTFDLLFIQECRNVNGNVFISVNESKHHQKLRINLCVYLFSMTDAKLLSFAINTHLDLQKALESWHCSD